MRWLGAVLVLGIAATARGDQPPVITQQATVTLTPIDSLASTGDYNTVFGGSAEAISQLSAIAQDASADVGVQLRAIRGLSDYPAGGTLPHDTLVGIIGTNANARTGSTVLILRAAIEALGALAAGGHAQPTDANLLIGHLNDSSRDVRATTARALGELCDTSAINPLRVRFGGEQTAQVKLAISEALRVLETCAPS